MQGWHRGHSQSQRPPSTTTPGMKFRPNRRFGNLQSSEVSIMRGRGRIPDAASWAFAVAEPTVTLTAHIPLSGASIGDVTADAGHVIGLTVNVSAGTPTGYQWTRESGPHVDTADATSQTLWVLCSHEFTPTTLVFRCTVTDDHGTSIQADSTVTVAARPPVQTQTGKGPTDPLPSNQDAYKFLTGNQLWDNRPGLTLNWSNATNVYNLLQDGRQVAFDGGALSDRHLLWMRSAFMIWTDIANVVWNEVADDPDNAIRVGYGDSGVLSLGATSYTNDGTKAALTLNPNLIDGGVILGISFDPSVARTPRHEVGHLIGLDHPDGNHSSPLMETQSHEGSGHVMEPQTGDIIGAQHLFGPATNAENTAPDVPTSMQISALPSGVEVAWGEPSITGGLPITGYIVNGPSEQTTTERRYTYTGLIPGESFDFYVQATNSAGTGLESRRVNFRVPDVTWAFAVPEPTVGRTPKLVDAGNAVWTFDLPEPSVDHNRQHEISAGDAAFAFAIPEPTVTKGYAVNAGDTVWAFSLPQPTVTHNLPHEVDAGDAEWDILRFTTCSKTYSRRARS